MGPTRMRICERFVVVVVVVVVVMGMPWRRSYTKSYRRHLLEATSHPRASGQLQTRLVGADLVCADLVRDLAQMYADLMPILRLPHLPVAWLRRNTDRNVCGVLTVRSKQCGSWQRINK